MGQLQQRQEWWEGCVVRVAAVTPVCVLLVLRFGGWRLLVLRGRVL